MAHHPAWVVITPVGPGHHTHSTPVPLRRESVGGSAQTHNTRQRQTMCPDLYPLRPVYAIAGKHNRIIIGRGVARAVQHVVPAPGGSLPPQRRRTMNMFHSSKAARSYATKTKSGRQCGLVKGFNALRGTEQCQMEMFRV